MAKYKTLTTEELRGLEKEFIDFLVINGITADDWIKIKSDNIKKANLIIDQFSDVIFESTLRKIKYLEFITPKSIKCFQCLDNEIVLVGVDAKKDSKVDFTSNDWQNDLSQLMCYTSSKAYLKTRELELFNMIENGASISDATLFKQLCLLL